MMRVEERVRRERGIRHQDGTYHEAIRGGSQHPEGIARDQRQDCVGGLLEHGQIVRIDDVHRCHSIVEVSLWRVDEDVVSDDDITQPTEKGIAMTCDDDIADLAREGCVFQMSGSTAKRLCVGAVQDDGTKRDSRDGEITDRRTLANDWSMQPRGWSCVGNSRPSQRRGERHDIERAACLPLRQARVGQPQRAPTQHRNTADQKQAL